MSYGATKNFIPRIVQKYGGASLSTPEKLKLVAKRISTQRSDGFQVIVVVSAMGRTTDILLDQAKEFCLNPQPRELDALLSTGEIVSSAMLTIALNNIGCAAQCFNGAQAGIVTDNVHLNANIKRINFKLIEKSLNDNYVPVIAGFQGYSDLENVTTLGRGGSDTTAVAIAACARAERCEILKDVPAIFSANPNVVPNAYPIPEISYEALLEMTFWGAKVLNYRSAEIAKHFKIPIYIGPANTGTGGTTIKEQTMIESSEIISLNSHQKVLLVHIPNRSVADAFSWLRNFLFENKNSFPQVLHSEKSQSGSSFYLSGPKEVLDGIAKHNDKILISPNFCSVTATCRGTTNPDLLERIVRTLSVNDIEINCLVVSSLSISVFFEANAHDKALNILHHQVGKSDDYVRN